MEERLDREGWGSWVGIFLLLAVTVAFGFINYAHAAALTAKEIMTRNEQARQISDVNSAATLVTGGGKDAGADKVKKFTWWRKLTADGTHFNTLTRFHEPAEVRGEADRLDVEVRQVAEVDRVGEQHWAGRLQRVQESPPPRLAAVRGNHRSVLSPPGRSRRSSTTPTCRSCRSPGPRTPAASSPSARPPGPG